MITQDDDRVAQLMRAADPCPPPENEVLAPEHRHLRNAIVAAPERGPRKTWMPRPATLARAVAPLTAIGATAVVVTVVAAAGGLFAPTEQPTGASPTASVTLSPAFERAWEKADTERQRQILSDGVITRDEYLELKHETLACMREQGLTANLEETEPGLFQMAIGGSDDEPLVQRVMDSCESAGFREIEALYSDGVRAGQG